MRAGHHLVPEILEAGWGSFVDADCGHLRPHAHPGAFELCLILTGEVEWETADSSSVLHAGDVYLTQPGETHWGRDDVMHPCTLYWLILGSPRCRYAWPGCDRQLAVHLERRLRGIRTHRMRGTAKLGAAFAEIFDEHAKGSSTRAELLLRRGNARAAMQQLLVELVRTYDRQPELSGAPNARGDLPAKAERVIEMLHSGAHSPEVVRRLCESIGSDHKKINQDFIEHVGMTVSKYWLRERVRLARERLIEPTTTVTEVATELGFSSSQHFATVFRRMTGLTPSEYRNQTDRANTQRSHDPA